jgi:hypothetical protein
MTLNVLLGYTYTVPVKIMAASEHFVPILLGRSLYVARGKNLFNVLNQETPMLYKSKRERRKNRPQRVVYPWPISNQIEHSAQVLKLGNGGGTLHRGMCSV